MGDEADQAQDYQARHNAEALALRDHQRQRMRTDGVTHCVECGGRIPRARRTALPGVQRCVECEKDFERRQRGV